MKSLTPIVFVLSVALGCAGPPLSLDLMPAPGIYSDGGFDPFTDDAPVESLPDFSLLYATLREPATEDDRERFYTNERGKALRAGVARVEVGRQDFTWEEARRVSLLKNRPDRYPLKVKEIDETGVISSSIFTPKEILEENRSSEDEFATRVNERVGRSRVKDVYIYVHGYKVVFENPLLVASELWHFLGYEGVMIAFSWPSTPRKLAYFGDLETAAWSVQGFRRLLSFLAEKTDVERIHVVAYSAGTRLVTMALHEIALMNDHESREQIAADHRIGDAILIGSDIDRELMGSYIEDGLLRVSDRLTVYLSGVDKALGMARWAFGGRERTGEAFSGELSENLAKLLWETEALSVIDVTDAEESDAGNGHAYFRKSPWASSDVLMTLSTDLGPGDRGLEREEDSPVWHFPADYVARLRAALETLTPGHSRSPHSASNPR